jgi:hypothetical protein
MALRGSCHCGAVAYRLDDEPREAMECNCSICRRKGYLLAFSTPDRFELTTSREALTVYTWNQHVIRHQFCRICGIQPFSFGQTPDGTPMVAINVNCLDDGVDPRALPARHHDGRAA